jgi:Methyladenine glycosylase
MKNALMRSDAGVDKRCSWVNVNDPLLLEYHDREWGVPVHSDPKHFEVLVLSGAQAGLNWSLVLKKREGYTMRTLPGRNGSSKDVGNTRLLQGTGGAKGIEPTRMAASEW